jgi:hypothetical protein
VCTVLSTAGVRDAVRGPASDQIAWACLLYSGDLLWLINDQQSFVAQYI